jgi:heat shock protein HtpX
MYIVNPLVLSSRGLADLTSTHPPLSERVRILRSIGGGALSLGSYDEAFRKVTGRRVGLVPAGALAASAPVPARDAPAERGDSHVERVRQATDALWSTQGYAFLACACGTLFKVPPAHTGRALTCPHCGRPLAATQDAARAAG